jgi:hypothetical protein
VSWDWVALLVVGGFGAFLCAALATAAQKESARLRLARVEVGRARPRSHHPSRDLDGRGPEPAAHCR